MISARLKGFFDSELKPWLKSVANYPYKEAKLIHYDYDLSKRWYVIFWAWDIRTNSLRRVRLFDPINRQKEVNQRIKIAMAIVDQVNNELRDGKVLGKDTIGETLKTTINQLTIVQAIDYVKKDKQATGHRKGYYRGFLTLKTRWQMYLVYKGIPDITLKKLSTDDLFSFFNYLKIELQVENKTYNNYRNNFATVINFLCKRDRKLFEENPITSIETLPVISRKHAAFTDEQLSMIKSRCAALGFTQLTLFIQFAYYTLARPNEIVQLKIRYIDVNQSRIFIPGEVSKTKRDEYIGISTHFKNSIIASGILNYSPNFFVFGSTGVPDEIGYATYQPIWRKNKKVLEDTGLYHLNKNFSLYSYKHSGAISLYVSTKDIKLLQRQCRHTTINQTNEYLRDLGLISGLEGLEDWKGIV